MSQNYLASRSSNLSSFNAIAMNYSTLTVSTLSGVSTLNVSRVITTSTIQVNSSMISLGASTNQVYVSSLSYGNFSTSTKWNTSMIDRLSTATVAMSANAQYQMTVSPSTTVSSIMYTSTLGSSWATISAATGLPSATATSYTAGAISGDGQYAALGAYGGYLYTTANSGATWTNTNPNTGSLYAQLAFEGNANDVSGNGRTVNTSGSPGYVTGIVGTRAINLVNASAAVQTQTVTISWTGATNFTISGWFNAQSVWPTIYNTNIFSAYNGSFALTIGPSIDSRLLRWYIPSGGSNNVQQVTNSLTIALNTWYNYTAIFQTGGLCSLYLNNVLVGSYTNTSGVGSYTTTSIVLGGYDLPHDPGNSFNGYMDDFKVYNSAITFTPMVPQNWSNVAVSNSGQYMLATATGAGLYMSSNFGSTWTQVTGAMLSAIWSAAQVSASGQYMLAYSTPIILQPQLTGLTGNNTTSTPVATSWQTGGITWTSNSSSVVGATFQSWCAFNNVVPPNSSSPSYSWASASTYSSGAYTGSVSTIIQSPGPGTYTGEWIQIQSPAPIVIYSYNFACGGIGNIPKTYYIVGSNDGSTWYPIQLVSIGTNPFTAGFTSATSSPIIVNQSGSQTMTAGTSGTLTCTTYTTNTTAAYTYFRFIANSVFSTGANFEFTELYLNFQAGAGGQTYSTNYGATWNNGYALPTPTALSLSGSGQYAIGSNTPLPFSQLNFEDNYVDSANGLATGVPSGTTANISTFSATRMVGLKSLSVTNTAAGTTNLGYVNYTIPSGSPLSLPNALTIALWIRPNSTTSQSSPLGFNNGISVAGPYFYLASTMSFAYYTTTQQSGAITSTSAIPTGSWTHVALTFSGGLLSLYINGSVQATRTITGSLSLDASTWGPITNMFIGCLYTTGGGYNGLIDDVRIYTYPLPASTINAMYLLSAPVVNITSNFLQGFSTGTSTTPNFTTLLNAETNVPVASAVSNTGQYMVLITNNISGNNVYYSTNFGALFTGLQLGTTLLTSCAISYDGSYITVSNATTTWTLNNNSNGFSLALGNQAGYQNQGQNAIAIGNGAGIQNQTANSIILNASGAAVNSFAPGFYVAPIASYTASSSGSYNLLGYGTDNQVVQTGITSLYGSNGNVGIGITNPRSSLEMNGTMIISNTSTSAILRFINESGINYIQSGSILADGSSAPLYFTSIYGQNKWMTIAANGNVGIGTTNPGYTLEVVGSSSISSTSYVAFRNTGVGLQTTGGDLVNTQISLGDRYGPYIRAVQPNNTFTDQIRLDLCTNLTSNNPTPVPRISILSGIQGGNVGIGTTNPGQLFSVYGNALIGQYGSPPSGSEVLSLANSNNGAYNTVRMFSTTSLTTGTIYYIGFYNYADSVGSITTNAATGVTTYGTSSDARLKKNINYEFDGLSIIDQLKPACFTMKSDSSDTVYHGFIAQDIVPIYPQYVTIPAEGIETGHYSMDYSQFTGIIVRAIKQQQTHIISQENEITSLKQQLTLQQTQIDALIQRLAAANIA